MQAMRDMLSQSSTPPIIYHNRKEMMCIKCRNIIRPPITKCRFDHVVCSNCNLHQRFIHHSLSRPIKSCEDNLIHRDLRLDETPVKELKYVNCQYCCGVEMEASKIGRHEQFCHNRNSVYKCYICYNSRWYRNLARLLSHVRWYHPEQMVDLTDPTTTVEVDAQKSSYLIIRYKTFLYWVIHHKKIDPFSKSNSILVVYFGQIKIGNQEKQSITEYSISGVSNTKLCVKDKVIILKDATIEEIIFSFLTLENGSCLSALKGDKYLVSFMNPSLLSLILVEFYCMVCLEVLSPPMRLCSIGHTICENCTGLLKNCPMCNNKMMNARNFALEAIVDHTMDLTRKKKHFYLALETRTAQVAWMVATSFVLYRLVVQLRSVW